MGNASLHPAQLVRFELHALDTAPVWGVFNCVESADAAGLEDGGQHNAGLESNFGPESEPPQAPTPAWGCRGGAPPGAQAARPPSPASRPLPPPRAGTAAGVSPGAACAPVRRSARR